MVTIESLPTSLCLFLSYVRERCQAVDWRRWVARIVGIVGYE